MTAYYSENDPEAVAALRELIASGLIAPGDVDHRSIKDVTADDLRGYAQCHFFAGAGLWSVAARLAGWPDERPLWSASCPCQPISAAGKQLGADDPRHLWPDLYRLIRTGRETGLRIPLLVGEQVAGALGYGWFDGVRADLAREDIAARTVDIPACAVDAPHERHRLWWCALANAAGDGIEPGRRALRPGWHPAEGRDGDVADADQPLVQGQSPARQLRQHEQDGGPLADTAGFKLAQWDGGSLRPGSASVESERRNDARHSMVYTTRQRWGKGRTEHALHQRRHAIADADVCQCGWPATPCDKRKHDYGHDCALGNAISAGLEGLRWDGDGDERRTYPDRPIAAPDGRNGSFWSDADWITCHDDKARRAKPGIRMLVDGMAGRIALWRLAGNSIVPQLAAEVLAAILDVEGGLT